MLDGNSLFSWEAHRPHALFICGCDGAGKTTFLEQLCPPLELQPLAIVDVNRLDTSQNTSFLSRGRRAIALLENLIAGRESFVRESTLTSHYDIDAILKVKQLGYLTELVFVGVGNSGIVQKRIQIAPEIAERHFVRGIANLPTAIELFDRVCLVDNTSPDFKVFARFENSSLKSYTFCPVWFRGIQKAKGYRFTGIYD